MKKHVNITALLLALLFIFLSGCRKNGVLGSTSESIGNISKSDTRDYLTLLYSSSDTFNPYTASTEINRQLCKLIFEPLAKTDNEFNLNYSLAEKIETVGTSCTVTLKNMLFSDGSSLTAEDVVYSFKLAKASSTEYAYKLYSAVSVSVQNSRTVVFKLAKADPYFENLIDFPIIKKDSDKVKNSDGVLSPPIGCGRYLPDGTASRLVINEKTLGSSADGYSIKEVRLIDAPDDESVSHYVEIGAADIYYSDISDGNILRMSGKKIDINLNRLVFIGVNHNYGELSSEAVRQAISTGIDRSAVCRDAYYNNAIAANGFYNPVWQAVKSVQNIELQANKEITVENLEKIGYNSLDSGGIRKKSDGTRLKFDLLVNKENTMRISAARLIASRLSECGFKINVVEKAYEDYVETLKSGSFQLYIAETAVTPNMDISSFVTEGGSVAYGIKSTKPSEAADDTESSQEQQAYASYELIKGFYSSANTVTDVATVLQTEMPIIPVCYRTGVLFCNDNIENVKNSSVSDIYFSIDSYIIKTK